MFYFLKIKKLIAKLLSFWLPKRYRKNFRNFIYYFSLFDYIRFKKQNFHIISLGNNCLPRVLTTAIRLKPRKIYGELTCPFDLANHDSISQITQLIDNDFENFFDGLILYDNVWYNKNISSKYIHDKNLSRSMFEKRYKKRIENFKNLIKSDKKIYFIYSNYEKENFPTKSDIEQLYNVLKKKRSEKPFELILLLPKYVENIDFAKQIVYNLEITDSNWAVKIIDEYNEFENKYKKYCKIVGNQLINMINPFSGHHQVLFQAR